MEDFGEDKAGTIGVFLYFDISLLSMSSGLIPKPSSTVEGLWEDTDCCHALLECFLTQLMGSREGLERWLFREPKQSC